MAVSSARGTIHLYAINREGGTPSFKTHNLCEGEVSLPRMPSNYLIDIHKVCDLQSVKKLHHEMKETRKDQRGSSSTTGGTKICAAFSFLGQSPNQKGSQSLLVQTPIAFHQYSLCSVQSEEDSKQMDIDHDPEPQKLFLCIENLHKFSSRELYSAQSVSYPYLHDQLYPQSTPKRTNALYAMSGSMAMSAVTMSIFNLDEHKQNQSALQPKDVRNKMNMTKSNALSPSKSAMSSSKYDEDTKRWLSKL